MSETCEECGATAPVFEGYCAECLDWYADHVSVPEEPATDMDTLRSARDAARKRMHATEQPRELVERVRRDDPTVTLDEVRAVLAGIAAENEYNTLAGICYTSVEAWVWWRLGETVQRWKAQRVAG